MGPLPNLIYYASISTREVLTVAEYNDNDGDEELPQIAAKCLQLLPPHHSRFSHTTNYRMFACIIDERFLYCTIADETLRRSQVMSFLEQVRHEFITCVYARVLRVDNGRLEANSLDMCIEPIFRKLVAPFVGIPKWMAVETESRRYADADADMEAGLSVIYRSAETAAYDNYNQASPCFDSNGTSRSPSTPLIGKSGSKKYKHMKKHKAEGKEAIENGDDKRGKAFEKVHKMEIAKDSSSSNTQAQRLVGSRSFRGQQVAQRMWWRSVKLVLLVDAAICLVLFGIWVGICRGFKCMK